MISHLHIKCFEYKRFFICQQLPQFRLQGKWKSFFINIYEEIGNKSKLTALRNVLKKYELVFSKMFLSELYLQFFS